ncbi:MAG: DegT/DnrJ/EryC1/StrS family aminotransferase [Blastocatellia bacterium]
MSIALLEHNRSWAAAGTYANPYEENFARAVKVTHAIAFGFARHALISILEAAGIKAGDEVILSPLTCKVVPLALLSLKLRPVYADISAETLNLDSRNVESVISSATRAILFQHTYGVSAGVEAVAEVAAGNNLLLVEDCAQCLPYAADDNYPGSWGQAAVFSNNLLKPLPAGSGGVAVTNDDGLARKIQARRDALPPQSGWADFRLRAEMRAHAWLLRPAWYWTLFNLYRRISPAYQARPIEVEIDDEITSESRRPSEYQMREGLRWLGRLESLASHRRHCCAEYAKALRERLAPDLNGADFKLIPLEAAQPLYYFPVLARNKPELLRAARSQRVELIAWPVSAPIYPLERAQDLRAYGYEPGACPVAEAVAAQLVGLPTRPEITAAQRRRIIDLLAKAKI